MSRVVHPSVKAAVLAWARASGLDAAAELLTRERQALPAELLPELVREVAEITAQTVATVLARQDGLVPDGQTRDVGGLALQEIQVERLNAWILDQERLAQALGLTHEAWLRALEAGMARMLETSGEKLPGVAWVPEAPPTDRRAFLDAPEVDRTVAGILGQLAARKFKP